MNDYVWRRGQAVKELCRLIDDVNPVVGVIDLDLLDERAEELQTAFHSVHPVLHTIAAKAIPIRPILAHCAKRGMGCEVASPGELDLALAAGFSPERIVFDSPAKTTQDLKTALHLGVSINFDNFTELARFDDVLALSDKRPKNGMGLRINPQLGAGTITAMSTATKVSKFGIGLADEENRSKITAAYLERPWLDQIHVHSGSQGVSLEQASAGIRTVVELADEINNHSQKRKGAVQIRRIDMGGGLPVDYSSDELAPSYTDYRAVLEDIVPTLFSYELITEFGRSIAAKSGSILSRVEFVKRTGGRRIATTHAGAQIVTRTAYVPTDWPLRVIALTPTGEPKIGQEELHDVAGPACFSGDLVAQARELPRLEPGDIVLIPDTGAYCFTSHYSYNMLPRIPILGYRRDESGCLSYYQLRKGQTREEIVAEAGPEQAVRLTPATLPKLQTSAEIDAVSGPSQLLGWADFPA